MRLARFVAGRKASVAALAGCVAYVLPVAPVGAVARPVAARSVTTRPAAVAGAAKAATAKATNAKPAGQVTVSASRSIENFPLIDPSEWPASGRAVIARARSKSVEARSRPAPNAPALRFTAGKISYGPVVFLALDRSNGYVKVALPVRPNGTAGWVAETDVVMEPMPFHITIELSTHTLTLERDRKPVLSSDVAVGTGGTPTPLGLFFVKELVPQADPHGPLGPIALGLSGYSPVLLSFAGGQGVIGLHGTSQPGSIGNNASRGCVRLPNATVLRLASMAPLGTPVEIVSRRSVRRSAPPERSAFLLDASAAASQDRGEVATQTEAPSPTIVAKANGDGSLAPPLPELHLDRFDPDAFSGVAPPTTLASAPSAN